MIAVKLQGRLGNQMFQYAFALAMSKKLNTKFFLDENEFSAAELKEFFELESYKYSSKHRLQKKYFSWQKYDNNVIEIDHRNTYLNNKDLLSNNNCIYTGFFQSEFYFHKHKELIKNEFIIKKNHRINIGNVLNIRNNKPNIVLHVRRTDYHNYGNESLGGENLTLPLKYYELCLQRIEHIEKYNIIFVTDDPKYVMTNFNYLNPITSSSRSPIIDFQIIMGGDIVVVANSSFSWWGGYLNDNASKIFAPKYWSGFRIKKEYPAEVIPNSWESIEF